MELNICFKLKNQLNFVSEASNDVFLQLYLNVVQSSGNIYATPSGRPKGSGKYPAWDALVGQVSPQAVFKINIWIQKGNNTKHEA